MTDFRRNVGVDGDENVYEVYNTSFFKSTSKLTILHSAPALVKKQLFRHKTFVVGALMNKKTITQTFKENISFTLFYIMTHARAKAKL